jgi:hypothetical protein
MFMPTKLEIRGKNCENCIIAENPQTECDEIKPNPSKDRGMLEGDNPSF